MQYLILAESHFGEKLKQINEKIGEKCYVKM